MHLTLINTGKKSLTKRDCNVTCMLLQTVDWATTKLRCIVILSTRYWLRLYVNESLEHICLSKIISRVCHSLQKPILIAGLQLGLSRFRDKLPFTVTSFVLPSGQYYNVGCVPGEVRRSGIFPKCFIVQIPAVEYWPGWIRSVKERNCVEVKWNDEHG